MKYLCLAYYNEKAFDALSKTEIEALVSQCHFATAVQKCLLRPNRM